MLTTLVCAVLGAAPMDQTMKTTQCAADGSRDQREILDHIHSIFQAYIRQDRAAIRDTHTPDWIGFQGPSTKIERGLDDYMRNAELSLQHLQGTGYEILDCEVQVFDQLALVYYVARYDYRSKKDDTPGAVMLRSIDVYRKEAGEWTQAESHITPFPTGGSWGEGDAPADSRSADSSVLRELSAEERKELLRAREAVWRAWFAGDEAELNRLVPAEVTAIDVGGEPFADYAEVVRRAAVFKDTGGRLINLEFPETRIQAYGDVVIIYTRFSFETERDGERLTTAGRGTEVFVKRDGAWLNTGWHLDSGR